MIMFYGSLSNLLLCAPSRPLQEPYLTAELVQLQSVFVLRICLPYAFQAKHMVIRTFTNLVQSYDITLQLWSLQLPVLAIYHPSLSVQTEMAPHT